MKWQWGSGQATTDDYAFCRGERFEAVHSSGVIANTEKQLKATCE